MIVAAAVLFFQVSAIPQAAAAVRKAGAPAAQAETSPAAKLESAPQEMPSAVQRDLGWSFSSKFPYGRSPLARKLVIYYAYAAGATRPAPANMDSSGTAKESNSFGHATIAPPDPPVGFRSGPGEVVRTNGLWAVLTLAQHGAATFDAWSTRRAISHGGRAETNPVLRPFAHSAAIYGAIQVGPGLLDYLGHRMHWSQKTWARRLWWVPQTASTVGFLYAGSQNLANTRR